LIRGRRERATREIEADAIAILFWAIETAGGVA
jgi:hypothetical protein